PLPRPGDDLAGNGDPAGRDVLQASDHVEKGRLAATAAADERDELVLGDGEIDIVEHRHGAAAALREHLARAIDADEGRFDRPAASHAGIRAASYHDRALRHDGLPFRSLRRMAFAIPGSKRIRENQIVKCNLYPL